MVSRSPDVNRCLKGLADAINNFCKSQKCKEATELTDVEGILIMTFHKGKKHSVLLHGRVNPLVINHLSAKLVLGHMTEDNEPAVIPIG